MSRLARFTTPHWIGGLAMTAAGVVLVRFAPPAWLPGARVAGQLLAIGGMFVIAVGISRRLKRGDPT